LLITFPGQTNPPTTLAAFWSFRQPQDVPFDIPFGKCVFMDTTFLPGTIVLDIAGHEIQLIPRVLTVDKKEIPWRSDTTLVITGTNAVPPSL
jgi:hypothetical protein